MGMITVAAIIAVTALTFGNYCKKYEEIFPAFQ